MFHYSYASSDNDNHQEPLPREGPALRGIIQAALYQLRAEDALDILNHKDRKSEVMRSFTNFLQHSNQGESFKM